MPSAISSTAPMSAMLATERHQKRLALGDLGDGSRIFPSDRIEDAGLR